MSAADRHQRISSLFEAASKLAVQDRDAYLKVACEGDEQLYHEVRELLALDEASGPLPRTQTALNAPTAPTVNLASESAVPSDLGQMVGSVFAGKYELRKLIGKGGFGAVFKAWDSKLRTEVAIKILRPRAGRSSRAVRDFMQEARRMTRLSHSNIVEWKVLDETAEGLTYFVMEFLEGEELMELIRREGTLDVDRTQRILLQVLDALRSAHELRGGGSILHLDLKPQNIFITRGPRGEEIVKVIDFGIGQLAGEAVEERAVDGDLPDLGGAGTLRVAEAGTEAVFVKDGKRYKRCRACTPEYASPEQSGHMLAGAETLPLDGRSDLYSLGVIAFQMLTGELPFDAPISRGDYLRMHIETPPKKLASSRRVPAPLRRLIERLLEKDREDRWSSADEAYKALHRLVHPPRGTLIARLSAAVLLLAAPTAYWLWPDPPLPDLGVNPSTLVLGPRQPRASVAVRNVELEGDLRWSLRPDPARAESVPDFTVEGQAGATEVTIDSAARRARFDQTVYLVGEDSRGRRQSKVLSVKYIAEGDWELCDPGEYGLVEGLGSKALDPAGKRIQVLVRGHLEDIQAVEVRAGQGAYREASPAGEMVVDGTVYNRFELNATEVFRKDADSYEIQVRDRAGLPDTAKGDIRVVRGGLAATAVVVDARRASNPDFPDLLTDDRLGAVRISSGHPADLSLVLLDENKETVELAVDQDGRRIDGAVDVPLSVLAQLAATDWYGYLRVGLDDNRYVLRQTPELGRWQFDVPLHYSGEALSLDATVAGRAEPIVRTNLRTAVIDLKRRTPFDVYVTVTSIAGVEVRPAIRHLSRQAPTRSVGIELPDEDGAYTVRLSAFREESEARASVGEQGPEGPGEESSEESGEELAHPAPEPEWSETFTFVMNRTALELGLACDDAVLEHHQNSLPIEIEMVDDADASGADSEIRLAWELFRKGRRSSRVRSGELTALPLNRSETLLVAPWAGEDEAPADGRYSLRVHGTDSFGNGFSREQDFDLAASPPNVRIELPVAKRTWERDQTGSFRIRVSADDPNGIEKVTYRLESDSGLSVEHELSRGSSSGILQEYLAEVELPRSWRQQSAKLTIEAHPVHGERAGVADIRLEIGDIPKDLPPQIFVSEELGATAMRLVLGNEDAPYMFRGRPLSDERLAAKRLGIEPDLSKTFSDVYEAGAIQDYYVDEQEVSVRQFRAFIADGFDEAAHWPGGVRGDRGALEQALQGQNDADPVVRVTWAEAAAYASWVGKRLISLVEFEYAARDGVHYHLLPATADQRSSAPTWSDYAFRGPGSPEVVHVRPAGWVGQDLTLAGLRNLGGNVRELTSTPASFDLAEGRPRDLSDHLTEALNPEGFEDAHRYWVGGGAYDSSRLHVLVREAVTRHARRSDIGFRCGMSAARAERLRSGEEQGPTVRAGLR